MSTIRRTIDIEDGLQAALNASGVAACAPPVPETLGEVLPFAVVTRTGGNELSAVQDSHTVSVDCYAATWAKAQALAGRLTALVRSLPGSKMEGVPVYASSIEAVPYGNADPTHPTVPRVTFSASITTRVAHVLEND